MDILLSYSIQRRQRPLLLMLEVSSHVTRNLFTVAGIDGSIWINRLFHIRPARLINFCALSLSVSLSDSDVWYACCEQFSRLRCSLCPCEHLLLGQP